MVREGYLYQNGERIVIDPMGIGFDDRQAIGMMHSPMTGKNEDPLPSILIQMDLHDQFY